MTLSESWYPTESPDAIALSHTQWWYWAAQLTATRIKDGHGPAQQIDARFYIVALHQMCSSITRIAMPLLDAPNRKTLGTAIGDFAQQCPDLTLARDIIMHFDEYTVGTGNKQLKQKRTDPTRTAGELALQFATGIGYYPAERQVRVGHLVFELDDTQRAATVLFDVLLVTLKTYKTRPARSEEPNRD